MHAERRLDRGSPLRAGQETTLYDSTREGTVIPREIVAWLQMLQLSQPVKFPKRDLSNGYLVAEICSLYWPEVTMYSYRNRLSIAAKKENWQLLVKAFTRNAVPLSEKIVNGMVMCKDHYAESFLRQLYTLLTGKEVIDARPLRKPVVEMDVYNPGVLAQQMKSTMEAYRSLKESEEKSNDAPPGAEDRRNGVIAGRSDLQSLPDISMANESAVEKKNPGVQPIRTFNDDRSEPESGASGAPTTEEGRSGFEFEVDVHAAEHTSTVVREPVIVVRRASLSTSPSTHPAAGATDSGVGKRDPVAAANATEWVESIVKRFTDDGWRLAPDCPTYMQFLLQHEADLEGSVQGAIWNALLSRIGELVDMIKHNSVALGDLVNLMLVAPDGGRGGWGCSTTSTGLSGGTLRMYSSGAGSPGSASIRGSFEATSLSGFGSSNRHRQNTPIVTSPRVFMFLAAILSHLTDLDPFYALSSFIRSVLSFPSIQAVLRRLNYHLADMYASLMCSVISSDQDTAMTLLPDLLSAAYESITSGDNSTEAKSSFLVLLRSILTRLVKPSRLQPPAPPSDSSRPATPLTANSTSKTRRSDSDQPVSPSRRISASLERRLSKEKSYESPAQRAGTPPPLALGPTLALPPVTGKRDLFTDLHIIASLNAVTALTSESVQLRTVGAAVAATLASTGYPVYNSIGQFKRLLFPYGASGVSDHLQPVDHVVRAMWLRAVQERLCLQETRFSPGNSNGGTAELTSPSKRSRPRSPGASGRSRSSHGSLASADSASGGKGSSGGGLATRDVLPLFESLSRLLTMEGGHKKSKTLVAYELAMSLNFLPIERLAMPAQGSNANAPALENPATADTVAGAVMTYFVRQCTSDLIAVVVAPPTDGRSANSNNTSYGPTGFGRSKEVGCIMRHPILGPLSATGMLRWSCPVLLCLALYKVALPNPIDPKDANRRLGVRAAAMARERVCPPDMLRRLQWLFWIVVSGRGFELMPKVTPFLTKSAMRRRWREVLFEAYDDISLITSASDTLTTQRSRMDDQAQSMIELGTKARRTVFRWHAELGQLLNAESDAAGSDASHKKSFLLEPNAIFEESSEKIRLALDWYHSNFNPGVRSAEENGEE